MHKEEVSRVTMQIAMAYNTTLDSPTELYDEAFSYLISKYLVVAALVVSIGQYVIVFEY